MTNIPSQLFILPSETASHTALFRNLTITRIVFRTITPMSFLHLNRQWKTEVWKCAHSHWPYHQCLGTLKWHWSPQRDKECWLIIMSAHNSVLTQTMMGEFHRSKNINMNTRTFPSEHCTVTNVINHTAMWIQALHKHSLWYIELNDCKLKEYLPPVYKIRRRGYFNRLFI